MSLTTVPLQLLDLSNNLLTGDIPVNGSFSLFTPISFANNLLHISPSAPPPPTRDTPRTSSGDGANGVIVGAIVAAAALLVVVPATALNLWRRKTQQDHFFDVAGWSIRRHVSSMCAQKIFSARAASCH